MMIMKKGRSHFAGWTARLTAWILCAALLPGVAVPGTAVASDAAKADVPDLRQIYLSMDDIPDNDYYHYISRQGNQFYKGEEILCPVQELVGGGELEDGGIRMDPGQTRDFQIQAPEEGLYQIGFQYRTADEDILPGGVAIMVNGEYPFPEMKRLSVDNTWADESDSFPYDRYGNEVMAIPVKQHTWNHTYLFSEDHLFSTPLVTALKEGTNTLSVTCTEEALLIGDFTLSAARQPEESFPEPPKERSGKPDGNRLIPIEAEHMTRRNSPNIRPDSIYDTSLTPYHAKKKVLNVVADSSFKSGGDRIEYDFQVKESGWYRIGFRYRQSDKANFPVFRNVYVDGKILSDAFQNMPFPYTTKFENQIVTKADGKKAAVFLEKGPHTIAVEVSLDHVRDAIRILTKVTDEMNQLALDIGRITGGNTGRFRDFRLKDFNFDVTGKLHYWKEIIDEVYRFLASFNPGVDNIGELAPLKMAARIMTDLAKEPDELPKKMDAFNQGTGSARQNLTTMIEQLNQSPLGLDKIFIFQDGKRLPEGMGFFRGTTEKVRRFFYSFGEQEYTPTYQDDTDHLQVWVRRPRQYLEMIQKMADTDFKSKYGIDVDLSIMPDQNKLILANASGKSPDVAMAIGSGLIYDLAIRGVLADMRKFDRFREVGRRFAPGMLIPGVADDGLYGIPETFNFWVMFYRKDILDSMGLKPPDTMEEVRQMLPQLQRRGLNFNSHVSNFVGTKPFAATVPFIYQNGGTLFDEKKMRCNLDTEEALRGMTMLTENYTIYDMPYEVQSFYQSFRDGRIPIGIADYGMLNLLTNAAPEIAGMWEVAPYPGVRDKTGKVQRWTLGSAESDVIFENSTRKEEAWKFLDWWTSTDVQTRFANTLQSTLGNEYLWNTSNLEAMANTPWIRKHKAILEQVKWTREPPRILGGYMIERELSNVVTQTVMEGENVRSAMDEAIKRINREITRKLEEFGYLSDGQVVKTFQVPDIDTVRKWVE
ncbi:extracellular solute-binding protein [Eubacteriales bacterium mix99]|jgi:ABC-type glycerol-3-phosphate transport system substrate-binding protein